MRIRAEKPDDSAAISALICAAFEHAPHRSGTEAAIVAALRHAQALTVSLVAELNHELVGHVAFSPVTISDAKAGWFGLGPLAVHPDCQRQGIAARLVKAGLQELVAIEAGGCVVLGDPDYYSRFGFVADAGLRYGDVPVQYFQRLVLAGKAPSGSVAYHSSFDVAATS
ncbi:N-acetyltransferase [Aureimonas fodinaquatilis]|uniref:N-acetyltransferase n=1 Tax=Aureimonas fodinaquatilis TaxID=2565783 RepID=A0A5B0DY08_9HYPH|nr:N-acetyltransferase [Aureimonas fodinaquatilis]KAA0971707.1 N-acetyltransferase [Aureimonas fodinaquatilis]